MINMFKIKPEHKFIFKLGTLSIQKDVLFASIKLNLFSHLNNFLSAKELSNTLGYDEDNTLHICNALASMDLLIKQKGKFKNTEISNLYLSKKSQSYAGDMLLCYHSFIKLDNLDIEQLVKKGSTKNSKNSVGVDAYEIFGDYSDVMVDFQRFDHALNICEFVKSLPKFNNIKRFLDLGGGSGLISVAIADANKNVQGVVFDTKNTIKLVDDIIKKCNMQTRLSTLFGDYAKDCIGSNYDMVLAVGTLNFVKDDLENVLGKIYNSLNKDGVFISISGGLTNEKTKPMPIVLGWLSSCLEGLDFALEFNEISKAAQKIGFKQVQQQKLESIYGELLADVFIK